MEPEGSSPHLQQLATYNRGFFESVVTRLIFYGEELLAPRPVSKLEEHPLSVVRDSYSIYSQLFCMFGGSSFIRNLRTRHAVVPGTRKTKYHDQQQHGVSHCRCVPSSGLFLYIFFLFVLRLFYRSERIHTLRSFVHFSRWNRPVSYVIQTVVFNIILV
jgi:hypothetical protein